MGSFTQHARDPIVGRLVDGRYRVTGVIARGGMATVYRADDTRLDRVVALKVMHRSFAEDPGFVARFEREARAAAKLSHPHLVGVFDQGAENGLVWLAMDYVPGHTLREVIRAHAPLDPDRALGVVEQILSGLSAAHEAGFVHRDIKPENVLMTPDGTMRITDFGLARAMVDDDPGAATKGVLIGTVAYLAPEQVETGHADERSDIYATGIVLYELLTGTVPFQGATPLSVAFQHVNDEVPSPSATISGIPADVDALVLQATARHPEHRFASAIAFLQAAQAVVVDDLPSTSSRDSADSAVNGRGYPSDLQADSSRQDQHSIEQSDPTDDWARIAAVTISDQPRTPTASFTPPNAPLVSEFDPDGEATANPHTQILSGIPEQKPGGMTATSVISGRQLLNPNAVPTSALGSGVTQQRPEANAVPTSALQPDATTIQSGLVGNSPSVSSRQGATPLTPVTRKPPKESDAAVAGAGEGVKSISRFSRTKLVVFLVLLITLVATGGWWLGMRHNAADQVGAATTESSQGAGADKGSTDPIHAMRRS